MSPFPGFPDSPPFTPLPQPFLTDLLPFMEDLAEVKVCLHLFRLLYRKRSYPRFVALGELLKEPGLGLGEEALRQALEGLCQRGAFLPLRVEKDGKRYHLYFLNAPRDREGMAHIERGEVPLGEIADEEGVPPPPKSNIFRLYEENIGLLTPLIAEALREAAERYPAPWIEEAFREAVSQNKRRWSYIARILERWAEEGKEGGKAGGHTKADRERTGRGRYSPVRR